MGVALAFPAPGAEVDTGEEDTGVASTCVAAEDNPETVTFANENRPEMKVSTLVGKGELDA